MRTTRIATIDVFRAITMFLMLFVNEIPGLKQIPHWMLHAEMNEDMLGFSDVIFPCILFVMGMSVLVWLAISLILSFTRNNGCRHLKF